MSFSFHPEAEEEFSRAVDYYEEIEPGLGYEFSVEVYETICRAVEFPKSWSLIEDGVRRSMVTRFPYGVLYTEGEEEVYILAVMHLHRHPYYWKHRK